MAFIQVLFSVTDKSRVEKGNKIVRFVKGGTDINQHYPGIISIMTFQRKNNNFVGMYFWTICINRSVHP